MTSDDLMKRARIFRNTARRAKEIKENAICLCESLARYFDNADATQYGLSFQVNPDGDRCICDISSAFGEARMVLGWRISESQVVGVLNVERKRFDDRDSVAWERVFVINVPSGEDNPYIGEGDEKKVIPIQINVGSGGAYAEALLYVGTSICLGIVSGQA